MLESTIIIGVVMAVMEFVKKTKFPKELYFVPVLVLAGGLSAANAYFFLGDVRQAVLEGLQLGAMASGIYGLAKAAIGQS